METVVLAAPEEVDAFVAAAARINDSDAACIALAGTRHIPLLTDDRKERAVAASLFPDLQLVSTLDVIEAAASALAWSDAALTQVATSLRWRGNFAPPRGDPRAEWYARLLSLGS